MSLSSEVMNHVMSQEPAEAPAFQLPQEPQKAYVELYDTTLRDGTQGERISFSVADKLRVTMMLDELGVAYIEGGWPGSNPRDAAYFESVRSLSLSNAKVVAFGMTCRVGARPEEDQTMQTLIAAGTEVVAVVGKTSMLHVTEVLCTTPEENLRMIADSVAFLKSREREVIYDAEHFFDGYREDPVYAMSTLSAARKAGADVLVLCDTNGGSMPWEVEDAVRRVKRSFPGCRIGIHTHNDGELAVANTLAAVRAGACHVQGTMNGYGERCGNANLCSVIPDLVLKMGYDCVAEDGLEKLTRISRTVAEMANLAPDPSAPYVGRSAFAHKGGMHAAAMRRHPASYQHVDPRQVGNKCRILVSDLAGRGNLMSKAEEYELKLSADETRAVVQEIKELESRGFVFEGADASVAMLMLRRQPGYRPPFKLVDFKVVVEKRMHRGLTAEATVKVEVDGQLLHTVSEGTGPVDALNGALRKALTPIYPQLESFRLADYKVRILDSNKGPAATTRVLIDSQNGSKRWTTVGASSNIIEASWQALADSVEFGLAGAHR